MSRKAYDSKLVVSGHVVETYRYEKPVLYGKESNNANGRSLNASEADKIETRKKTMSKAKQDCRRLINANVDAWNEKPKFLTLTFAENVQDIPTANYEFKKFRQRLEYELEIKLKYVVVMEFQKRGAIHYHAIFFNLPYVPNERLRDIWGHGFIRINQIDNVDNVGAYVTKYMTKEQDGKMDKLIGKKSYFTSRGLVKPEVIIDKKKIEQLTAALSGNEVYYTSFANDYLGDIEYTQYNTKRKQTKEEGKPFA